MSEPKMPEVGEYLSHAGTLLEVQDVTPPPPVKRIEYIFEEKSARIEARVNGKVINTYGTFNCWGGGHMHCVKNAMGDVDGVMDGFGVAVGDIDSSLEFFIVLITEQSRKMPTGEVAFRDKRVFEFKGVPHRFNSDVAEPVEEDVWSSHKGFLRDKKELGFE